MFLNNVFAAQALRASTDKESYSGRPTNLWIAGCGNEGKTTLMTILSQLINIMHYNVTNSEFQEFNSSHFFYTMVLLDDKVEKLTSERLK